MNSYNNVGNGNLCTERPVSIVEKDRENCHYKKKENEVIDGFKLLDISGSLPIRMICGISRNI